MRDVMKAGRPAMLPLTALKYGWRRVGEPFMAEDASAVLALPSGTGPFQAWVSPWGWYIAADVTVLREPLRQKVVCDQRLFMSGICPCCYAQTERREHDHLHCEHEPGCPVSAESILHSAGASAN